MDTIHKLSQKSIYAINSKKEIVMRLIQQKNIIDRVITPIGFSDDPDDIVLYSHIKRTYINGNINGISESTTINEKEMPPTSNISGVIYDLLEILERNGYFVIFPVK